MTANSPGGRSSASTAHSSPGQGAGSELPTLSPRLSASSSLRGGQELAEPCPGLGLPLGPYHPRGWGREDPSAGAPRDPAVGQGRGRAGNSGPGQRAPLERPPRSHSPREAGLLWGFLGRLLRLPERGFPGSLPARSRGTGSAFGILLRFRPSVKLLALAHLLPPTHGPCEPSS